MIQEFYSILIAAEDIRKAGKESLEKNRKFSQIITIGREVNGLNLMNAIL